MVKLFSPVKSSVQEISPDAVDSLDYLLIERRFGKTTHFVIVDSDTGNYQLIKNTNKHQGGNKHTPDIVKENNADVVVAAHMGAGAHNGISEYGIEILRGDLNTPLSIIVEKFKSGALEKFTTPTVHEH